MISDVVATAVWFLSGAAPFFIVQLLICFKIKNRFFRFLPIYVLIAGAILTVDVYFNFSGLHSGWHELGAVLIAVYVFMFSVGDIAAWMVYYFRIKYRMNIHRNKH